MPELPEVEAVRRSLRASVPGAAVTRVRVFRRDVVRGPADAASLLEGRRLGPLYRHGKQLAITDRTDGPCLCLHLGMTGFLGTVDSLAERPPHTHVAWRLDRDRWLVFRDVRRFGGVWAFRSLDELLATRWGRLGRDALVVEPCALADRLRATRRAVKTALLDQNLVAGLGNIYVDELLHRVGIAPARRAHRVSRRRLERLGVAMRELLEGAIRAGGSTFRDYADGQGRAGSYQRAHRVYGRAGAPCMSCGRPLRAALVGGRATVDCPRCQR